jgi:hypothetical protein
MVCAPDRLLTLVLIPQREKKEGKGHSDFRQGIHEVERQRRQCYSQNFSWVKHREMEHIKARLMHFKHSHVG